MSCYQAEGPVKRGQVKDLLVPELRLTTVLLWFIWSVSTVLLWFIWSVSCWWLLCCYITAVVLWYSCVFTYSKDVVFHLSVSLSICLSVSVGLSVCLSVSLSVFLSVSLSLCLSVCLSVCCLTTSRINCRSDLMKVLSELYLQTRKNWLNVGSHLAVDVDCSALSLWDSTLWLWDSTCGSYLPSWSDLMKTYHRSIFGDGSTF